MYTSSYSIEPRPKSFHLRATSSSTLVGLCCLAALLFATVVITTASDSNDNGRSGGRLVHFAGATTFPELRPSVIDPRCTGRDFKYLDQCPWLGLASGKLSASTLQSAIDPSSCNRLGDCPQCLVGDVWAQRLEEMGLGTADRRGITPWVLFRGWYSHELLSTIAMLLLRDALGYETYGRTGDNKGNHDMICCGNEGIMFEFERWSDGTGYDGIHISEEGYFTVAMLPVGYAASTNFYIPDITLQQYPLANSYNAYKYLENYNDIFPKAFATACEHLVVTPDSCRTATPDYICNFNEWTDTLCDRGRYVPPQCQGDNAQYCQEVYHPDPTSDPGRFEGMIRVNKLNFTVAYVGYDRYPTFIKSLYDNNTNFMFYWSHPDPLVSAVNGKVLMFDANTNACEAAGTLDPSTSEAGCAYLQTTLLKAARRDVLHANPDLKHFVESFTITDDLVTTLLAQHRDGSGNKSIYDISCDYLKNNHATWSKWIQHTPPTTDGKDIIVSAAEDSFPMWIIAIIIVVVLLIFVVLGVVFVFHRRYQNRNAPKKSPLALIFTDVESSTTLWEACRSDMEKAMRIHNAVIRELIAEYQAYEVKTNGDSFMIACKSLTDATLLALAIQSGLNERSDTPISIAKSYSQICKYNNNNNNNNNAGGDKVGGDEEEEVWRGLRVRIALHWCDDVTARVDGATSRYDYFGHDVNVTARVEGYAAGGQIMVESTTYAAIQNNADLMELVEPMATIKLVARNAELKGVLNRRVSLYSIVPSELARRRFAPIVGGDGACVSLDTNTNHDVVSEKTPIVAGDTVHNMFNNGDFTHNTSVHPLNTSNSDHSNPGDRAVAEKYHHNNNRTDSLKSTMTVGAGGNTKHDNGAAADAPFRFAFNFVLNSFPSEADRKKWLQNAAAKHNLPTHYNTGRLMAVLQVLALRKYRTTSTSVGSDRGGGGGGGGKKEGGGGGGISAMLQPAPIPSGRPSQSGTGQPSMMGQHELSDVA